MTTFRRRVLASAAAAAVAIGLVGCAESNDDRIRIGVTVYGQDNFATQGREGIEAYAEARDIELLWNSADGDVANQANQIDQYINAGVDAILVAPVQFDSLGPQLKAAKDAGIHIGFVNATVQDDSSVDVAVLPDNVAAGRQAAQMMMDHLGGNGKVAILQCLLGASYEIQRTQGMEEVIAEYPGVEVVAKDGASNIAEATDKVKNWMTAVDEIDGVIACGDEIGLGALQAANEAGKEIAIVGVDGTEDGLNAIKDGRFIGSQMQHARTEFAAGLAAVYHLAKGETMEELYTYTMDPVTADNVDDYYVNVVSEKDAFLERIADVVDRNLDSGKIEDES
ncbi:monosaccharide ABC transporter substrate-binding protein (CUT2 family) [Stackebrandtia endophytica]|uniref:Monosaccharide ABC transporter substrate-binding protein (CUT2 family) n=1 Tax=Stackebrandtia endophytica TaxID=1496996 RepID=A0A543ATI3_9ACTN|nr:substrate-binding domain-containing protein [Stackebrandtia endophytica]TQL75901.1 monosaccharide ABC transporter substrate-binding protein (CUT2 family) [Stackebrandtia endophytica]